MAHEDMKQIPTRVHINDYAMLKRLLTDAGMTYQAFVSACVEAYLNGSPTFIQVVQAYKDSMEVPRSERVARTLSHRERLELLKELEGLKPNVGAADPERKDT